MAANHIMVDIETFGLTPGSAIRSIAAVRFDPAVGVALQPSFSIAIDIDSHDMERNPATVKWWDDQPEEAKRQFANPVSLRDALTRFNTWWACMEEATGKLCHFWAKSPSFDAVLLKAAYAHAQIPPPWSYRLERDVRTVYGLVADEEPPFQGVKHDALADCLHQIGMVTAAYRTIGVAD